MPYKGLQYSTCWYFHWKKNQWKVILTDDWLLVTLAFCPSLSSSIGAGSSTTSAGTTSFGGSGGDAGGSDPANRANLFRRIWKSKFQCNVLTEKKLCEVNSQKISRNKNQQEFNFARGQSDQPFQPDLKIESKLFRCNLLTKNTVCFCFDETI